MRLRTIAIALVVLLAAAAVTVVAILKSMDFNSYRGLIAERVEAATGRKLVIGGDIELAVSLTPTAAVNDVTFANVAGGSRPAMASLKRLEAEMELLPLLSGEVRVKRIVLVGADILLETDKDGRGNWVFASAAAPATAPADGGPTTLPTVNEVAIEDARVTYRDGVSGATQSVALTSLSATAADAASPIRFVLEGLVNDAAVSLSGSIGALQRLLEGAPFPVDVEAKAGGAVVAIKGEIAQPAEAKGLALAVSAQGQSLADLGPLLGQDLPPLGPYTVSAKLTDADGGGYRLVGLQARLGDSDLSGDVTVALGGARPRLDATLVSNRLDLKDFGVEPAAAAPATGDGRLFPADPLPLDGLRAADATVELNAQTVVRGPVALENVRLKLTLTNGKLAVAPFAADLAGGSVEAVVDLDAGGDVPAVGTKLTARQVEAGALLRTLGISEVLSGGRLDLDVDVRGGGESVRAIMAGLDGTASLQMGSGRIDDGFVELLLADLVKLISFGGAGDNSTINCLVGGFDIENGLAVSRGLVLDTPGAAVVGSGRIHLDSEKLDLHFQPKAKQTNLVNLAIPVNVGGTLASPRVTPDPVGTVTGVVGGAVGFATGGVFGVLGALTGTGAASGSGEENPCAAALAAGQPAAPTSVPEQVLEGTGDVLKGVGDTIKGLFQ
ncbi:MAG: AsmA family protein [Dongiaceae bacterium]